jgi:exosortase
VRAGGSIVTTEEVFEIGAKTAERLKARSLRTRHLLFISWVMLCAVAFWQPLRHLVNLSIHDDEYSHAILIPFLSALVAYWDRRRIFTRVQGDGRGLALGGLFILGAASVYFTGWKHLASLSPTDFTSSMVGSLVLAWSGGFVACYGVRAFRSASFPLLFLVLMIPLPGFLLTRVVSTLQQGSAAAAYAIFKLVRVPVQRTGLVFALPGISIRIAPQCSGIRSTMALLITALLGGHFFLRTYVTKTTLVAFMALLVVVKNGLRIATISLLSVYANPGFIHGDLHRYGGIPFSMVSVAILIPVLWRLQKSEKSVMERV